MEVFLVPVAVDRYEPYCEVSDDPPGSAPPREDRPRWYSRLHDAFHDMLAAAERERVSRHEGAEARRPTWWGSARARALRWVSERIAEQRLLWHLRRQDRATLVHPSDLDGDRALAILRDALRRDGDRHQRWLIFDGLLLVASSVLTLIPGPNVIWWYFAFRATTSPGAGRARAGMPCRGRAGRATSSPPCAA
jgi:hypothetical protein